MFIYITFLTFCISWFIIISDMLELDWKNDYDSLIIWLLIHLFSIIILVFYFINL